MVFENKQEVSLRKKCKQNIDGRRWRVEWRKGAMGS